MDIRIYYEDTDAAGVVYHANYVKFFERARTEFFRSHGLHVGKLAEEGFIFPVIRIELDYRSPARHDDLITVTTTPVRSGNSSFTVCQQIVRKSDAKLLAEGLVTLACVNPALKAIRIPAALRSLLDAASAAEV